MKTKPTAVNKDEIEANENEDLEFFIKKKKAQTEVLKKLITKLNIDENYKINK